MLLANFATIVSVQQAAPSAAGCLGTQFGTYSASAGISCNAACELGPASSQLYCGTSMGLPTYCCYQPTFLWSAAANPSAQPVSANILAYPFLSLPVMVREGQPTRDNVARTYSFRCRCCWLCPPPHPPGPERCHQRLLDGGVLAVLGRRQRLRGVPVPDRLCERRGLVRTPGTAMHPRPPAWCQRRLTARAFFGVRAHAHRTSSLTWTQAQGISTQSSFIFSAGSLSTYAYVVRPRSLG